MENGTSYQNLLSLEKQLAGALGSSVFDYVFLFDKKLKLDIQIGSLSEKAGNLIHTYLQATNDYLKENGVPEIAASSSLQEDFLFALRNNYIIRYARALSLYADYNLTRVPTEVEKKMLEVMKRTEDLTISFYIPDAFVIDQFGLVDLAATKIQENKNQLIARFLSAATLAELLAGDIFEELKYESKRQLAFAFFSDQLFLLVQKLVQQIIVFFAQTTYQYLHENFTINDALANTSSYFAKSLQFDAVGNWRLLGLENQLSNVIESGLTFDKKMNQDTKNILRQEIMQKLLKFLKGNKFYAKDYYRVELKTMSDEESENYRSEIGGIVDLYLILPDGKVADAAGERYLITLTDEAKALIFQEVTNEIVNPQFTLEDYLVL